MKESESDKSCPLVLSLKSNQTFCSVTLDYFVKAKDSTLWQEGKG